MDHEFCFLRTRLVHYLLVTLVPDTDTTVSSAYKFTKLLEIQFFIALIYKMKRVVPTPYLVVLDYEFHL